MPFSMKKKIGDLTLLSTLVLSFLFSSMKIFMTLLTCLCRFVLELLHLYKRHRQLSQLHILTRMWCFHLASLSYINVKFINIYIVLCYTFLFLTDSHAASSKMDPLTLPTFLTSSQVFKIIDKETVTLPCQVANPGKFYLYSIISVKLWSSTYINSIDLQ